MSFRRYRKAVQEGYSRVAVVANAQTPFTFEKLSGFLATSSGNIQVFEATGEAVSQPIPVTAGVYLPFPFYVSDEGGYIISTNGAVGVLGGS